MRKIAFALAFALAASPAFAKGKKHKDGEFCSKKMSGKTATDKSGASDSHGSSCVHSSPEAGIGRNQPWPDPASTL